LGHGDIGMSLAADNPSTNNQRLAGMLDQVRIWKVARTPSQICAAAGEDC
jgi:hypothetical protein